MATKFQQTTVEPVTANSVWQTTSGDVYEEVEAFVVRAGAVTFRHKNGTARLPIADLTGPARIEVILRYRENHSLAVLPRENEAREVGALSEAA